MPSEQERIEGAPSGTGYSGSAPSPSVSACGEYHSRIGADLFLPSMKVEHADALEWLCVQPANEATLVVFDPPYAVGTPVRGKEDGAAGSVFGPLSFMSRTLTQVARVLRPGGVCMVFADWRRMPDLAYIASTTGLRPSTCIAWTRKRPGTGGLFRSAWDPILIVARGVPDAIDRAAVRNVVETDPLAGECVVEADYPTKRTHPYGKPEEPFRHVMSRICKPGDLVLDPFAGSAVSGRVAASLGLRWRGCDVDQSYAAAPGTEARRAETGTGSVHDGPSALGGAPQSLPLPQDKESNDAV